MLVFFVCCFMIPGNVAQIAGLVSSPVAVFSAFYMREVAQYQEWEKKGWGIETVWSHGWWPGKWDRWSIVDVVLPTVSSVGISLFFLTQWR